MFIERLALEAVSLIDVQRTFEAGNTCLVNVADRQVRVERFFEHKRRRAVVSDFEFHLELGADGKAKAQLERRVTKSASGVIRVKGERDLQVAIGADSGCFHFPWAGRSGAGRTMER